MHTPTLIERKRDGGELAPDEIAWLIRGYTLGEIPDYQMSAFAMAVMFRSMTPAETAALTLAMRDSGEVLAHPPGSLPCVDKHSTGGIGDKVSLVLAPLLACAGLRVPMISGRGLGLTGGTLDKLESIPGFQVNLSRERTMAQLDSLGFAMIGQTPEICPADRKLYALRDVTATVPSVPLIVASILSKKLAESLDRLVLDVKFGSGAFMRTRPEAERLADALRTTAHECGLPATALLHPMDEPTGNSVGNALEVAEALETLQGRGPEDLERIVLDLAVQVSETPRDALAALLRDGSAFGKFLFLVEAQGGDPASLPHLLTRAHPAPVVRDLRSERSGQIVRMDAEAFGRAALALGAGRRLASDAVDPAVGFDHIRKVGESVRRGDVLCRLHARTETQAELAAHLLAPGLKVQ